MIRGGIPIQWVTFLKSLAHLLQLSHKVNIIVYLKVICVQLMQIYQNFNHVTKQLMHMVG